MAPKPTNIPKSDNTAANGVELPKKQREWSVVQGKQLIPNGYVVNWNEGMLKQCKYLEHEYIKWVDHAKLRRVRMFDSNYIEAASFTPWWIVPAIYIPWGLLEARLSYQDLTNIDNINLQSILTIYIQNTLHIPSILLTIFVFIIGIISWTLFEYTVHRHVFHFIPPSSSWNIVHFVGHGMHHLTPSDKYRLVFPPAISLPLGIIFRFIFYNLLFSFGIRSAFFGGFVVGYACYESIHYLGHHCVYGSFLYQRFVHHSAHHFNPKKQDKLFGVSSQIWDVVFDTM